MEGSILFPLFLSILFSGGVRYSEATEASQSPTLVDPVERLNHAEGTNATLTCSVGSGDLNGLTFDWFKDERKLSPSVKHKIVVLPDNVNSILRIIDLKPEDSASYSCVARNKFGQDRISTRLVVKVQLKWLVEPRDNLEIGAGEPLDVSCAASGQPTPSVQWTRLSGNGPKRDLGSALRFNMVSQDDSGLYECRASNGADKDLVARVNLTVLDVSSIMVYPFQPGYSTNQLVKMEPLNSILAALVLSSFVWSANCAEVNVTVSRAPKILDQFDKLNYPDGTNATMMCSIGSGDLDGLTYEWLKDDKKLTPSSRYRIAIAPENYNSILRVIDLRPDDSGLYSCVARNTFGMDRISIRLQVKVQLKWIAEPKGGLEAQVGRPLFVPCAAEGQPPAKIVWTQLGEGGNQSRPFGHELRFDAVRLEDSGLYECRASNGLEEDLVGRVNLSVLGK